MTRAVEELLLQATREVQVLAAATPDNAAAERARLTDALRRGAAECPRWSYRDGRGGGRMAALRAALQEVWRAAKPQSRKEGVGALVAERARELAVEAALCEAVGTGALPKLAEERFAPATREVEIGRASGR